MESQNHKQPQSTLTNTNLYRENNRDKKRLANMSTISNHQNPIVKKSKPYWTPSWLKKIIIKPSSYYYLFWTPINLKLKIQKQWSSTTLQQKKKKKKNRWHKPGDELRSEGEPVTGDGLRSKREPDGVRESWVREWGRAAWGRAEWGRAACCVRESCVREWGRAEGELREGGWVISDLGITGLGI